MTTEPIIVSADTTVAEGLALIRRHELAPALGAAVCVTLPPFEPPTGRFLGMVHFQRMLRYPPNERLGTLLDQSLEPVLAERARGRGRPPPGQLQPRIRSRCRRDPPTGRGGDH